LKRGLLPPAETEESRRDHEIVLDIQRRRAERLGLSAPDDIPEPEYRHGMSIAEIILASRERARAAKRKRLGYQPRARLIHPVGNDYDQQESV
jgi:hypothetical protein